MINRRLFLAALAAAATPGSALAKPVRGFGRLQPDPGRILDLPEDFRYNVVARFGDPMDDGLVVPHLADGMAAFAGPRGTVILVCNHENAAHRPGNGAFGAELELLPQAHRERLYDAGRGVTPGTGGTTTIVWDPRSQRRLRQHLSLGGTEVNCAGGPTPWGSWLSCEETFREPGTEFRYGRVVHRERRHGYVFEVPARATGMVEPVPLTGMGRFEHEAAAVDPASGAVYLTEDRHRSLLYRYLPDIPGQLAAGGRLQALAIAGQPSFDTRNWGYRRDIEPGATFEAEWIDLENVDSDDNDLRLRGFDKGAARFARGEGLCYAGGEIVMTCTIGGVERLGQVFAYRPRPDGRERTDTRGSLRLVAESTSDSLLHHADNVVASPWGDLVVCEDTAGNCSLVGIRPDGRQYAIADNAYEQSELAGACFSPDGRQLFVNVQARGLTLAISGPWERLG